MTPHAGHLFVVHGKIEQVIHDAAIVPVDEIFDFNRAWQPVIGEHPQRPSRWGTDGWGRLANAPEPVWAVNIIGTSTDPYTEVLHRISATFADIRGQIGMDVRQRGSDSLPLIAMPVLGIGLGGYGDQRGAVIRDLVKLLKKESLRLDLDIVLVSPDPAVYAGVQYARRGIPARLPKELENSASRLAQHARNGSLALFLGAGASMAAGLPGWDSLIEDLAADLDIGDYGKDQHLSATDQAELIQLEDKDGFQQRVADRVKQKTVPSLLHSLLAGLDCKEVVTTNYDLLYEGAVRASGRPITSVLPWTSAQSAKRWILKLHGDVQRPDAIVLTRRHMVKYDAANRPSGALLQALLLTRHLLMVGVSMTDDNVIRLMHEVEEYRSFYKMEKSGPFGTVIDTDSDATRSKLWKGQLNWVSVASDSWAGRRGAELFLDRIAFHAARDSSWLLDSRFVGLLEHESDRVVATQAQQLYAALPKEPGTKWDPLLQRLEELGVNPESGAAPDYGH